MGFSSILRESRRRYRSILDNFAIVASAHSSENELGAASFATNSLLAPLPADAYRRTRVERSLHTFGGQPRSSAFRTERTSLAKYAAWLSTAACLVLHEGFMVEPYVEASTQLELLRNVLGDRLWVATPEVWRAWGSKAEFRQRCRNTLGERSVPPGIEFTALVASDIVAANKALGPGDSDIRIVKLPGIGGQGNLVLNSATHKSWGQQIEELWQRRASGPLDIVIEHWLPWEASYSVSYLVPPDAAPRPIAVCEQTIDRKLGRFVGSRNDIDLSDGDIDAMLAWLQPLFEAMGRDGFTGVAAIDVIVDSGKNWNGYGYRLPSGKTVSAIECNPRFNRHNRVGLFVERLARKWKLDSSDLSWTLRDVYPADAVHLRTLINQLQASDAAGRPQRRRTPEAPPQARLLFADRLDRVMELNVAVRSRTGGENDHSAKTECAWP
jgi:hypothetical protein